MISACLAASISNLGSETSVSDGPLPLSAQVAELSGETCRGAVPKDRRDLDDSVRSAVRFVRRPFVACETAHLLKVCHRCACRTYQDQPEVILQPRMCNKKRRAPAFTTGKSWVHNLRPLIHLLQEYDGCQPYMHGVGECRLLDYSPQLLHGPPQALIHNGCSTHLSLSTLPFHSARGSFWTTARDSKLPTVIWVHTGPEWRGLGGDSCRFQYF